MVSPEYINWTVQVLSHLRVNLVYLLNVSVFISGFIRIVFKLALKNKARDLSKVYHNRHSIGLNGFISLNFCQKLTLHKRDPGESKGGICKINHSDHAHLTFPTLQLIKRNYVQTVGSHKQPNKAKLSFKLKCRRTEQCRN